MFFSSLIRSGGPFYSGGKTEPSRNSEIITWPPQPINDHVNRRLQDMPSPGHAMSRSRTTYGKRVCFLASSTFPREVFHTVRSYTQFIIFISHSSNSWWKFAVCLLALMYTTSYFWEQLFTQCKLYCKLMTTFSSLRTIVVTVVHVFRHVRD